ncbi:MAG: peptidylprolyl isomerase [Bacilli bacterium]|nr:peptidylprolyl isomerase [Bacilli bacterium]
MATKKETGKTSTKTSTKKETKKAVTKKTVKKEEKKVDTKKKEIKKIEKKVEVVETKEKKDHKVIWAFVGIALVVIFGVVVNLIKEVDHPTYRSGKVYAGISVKDYGNIYLELDADVAPITVTNFINLANSGFYDNLTFHRMIKGFMMQGGDPLGNGYGDNGTYIEGEFESNGHKNDISHVRGTISMARGDDPNSASTQFFIVTGDATYLDGNYAAFGKVIEGMDVVDKLMEKYATKEDEVLKEDKRPIIETIQEIVPGEGDIEYEVIE